MTFETKLRRGLLVVGLLTLAFNIGELVLGIVPPLAALITIMECLMGIGLIYGPQFLKRFFKIVFPPSIVYFYWFFLLISVFVGTCLHMMDIVPFWDKILHMTSPMILTAVGYGIVCTLFGSLDNEVSDISPWVFLLFGFSFAGVCGVFWEFWEWSWDAVGNMNLQRYMTIDGVEFVGRAALSDTMGDLLINTIGAVIMGVFSWNQYRKNAKYFEGYQIQILK
jgi:hypothetical protein